MAYLPRIPLEDTTYPKAWEKDLRMQIRMIEELYTRQYPIIDYNVLRIATTPMTPDPHELTGVSAPGEIVGEAGTTPFDPVWGEAVPETMRTTGWQQPHLSGVHDAADPEQYTEVIPIHARIQREAKEKELKHLGFDEIRDLLVYVPLSTLDRHGIVVNPDDMFVWDGVYYMVKQLTKTGYWHNTNIRLYIALNCESKKSGS